MENKVLDDMIRLSETVLCRFSSITFFPISFKSKINSQNGTEAKTFCLSKSRGFNSINVKKNMISTLDQESSYVLSISSLMEEYLKEANILDISSIKFWDSMTLDQLSQLCEGIDRNEKNTDSLITYLEEARAYAFTQKYAEPREDDEKIMKIEGLESWHKGFYDVLSELQLNNLCKKKVLNLGVGHGKESAGIFESVNEFIGVDISEKALENAKKNFPNMRPYLADAACLEEIPPSSIDVYLSLRTYQSTLFDIDRSIREAYRVLKPDGKVLISIPKLYVSKDGRMMTGLRKRYSKKIVKSRLTLCVENIKMSLSNLNFSCEKVFDNSVYETYITATKNINE